MPTPSTLGLTQNELESFDHFLRNQIGTKNNFGLTHMHGFLCAMLTAPVLSHTDQHAFILDKILGIKQLPAHDKYRLWLAKLIHQISSALQEDTSSPLLFGNNLVAHKETMWELLKEWCQGYLQGVGLDAVWMKDEHGLALIMPMGILADEFDLSGLPNSEGQPILDNMPHKILAHEHLHTTVATLYDYWKEQRLPDQGLKNLH
jgi:uncharacterized protein YgfB (UPF0149 family)